MKHVLLSRIAVAAVSLVLMGNLHAHAQDAGSPTATAPATKATAPPAGAAQPASAEAASPAAAPAPQPAADVAPAGSAAVPPAPTSPAVGTPLAPDSTALAKSVAALPPTSPLKLLVDTLAKSDNPIVQANILRGIQAALKGKRDLPAPAGWESLYAKLKESPNEEVRQQVQALAVVFGGGGGALEELRAVLADAKAPADRRKNALEALVSARDAAALPIILKALEEAGPLRRIALRGLAVFDSQEVATTILAKYATLGSEEKRDALATLTSRPAWARELIGAVKNKAVERAEISAPLARQLQDLKDAEVSDWIGKEWGAIRTTSAEKQKEIARLKGILTPAYMREGDPLLGRAFFGQTCAICHALFGTGGKVGPELPGAFEDIDYLLQNILDPNAIIGKDYQQTVVQTKQGQTMIGIVAAQDDTTVTLKSLAGPATIQRSDIESLSVLDVSLMPEGLLAALKDEDVRDLFSYLSRHGQAPMLATAANVNDFFNGADLSRWYPSNTAIWKLENGVIEGHGSADRAEFLVSDMAVENYRFQAKMQLSGKTGFATIAFRGMTDDGGFRGSMLRLGGDRPPTLLQFSEPGRPEMKIGGTEAEKEQWVQVEIIVRGKSVRIGLDDKLVFNLPEVVGGLRTVFAFQVAGEGTYLRVKDVKLDLME